MYRYKTLKDTDIATLHRAFTAAFSDYQIDSNMPSVTFEKMMKRRGFAPDYSIGAFTEPGNELVGFILNGIRTWKGELTAYDLGTGVVPPHRKKGISRNMFHHVQKIMERNNVSQYLLEVLQENAAAIELYRSMGLLVTRNYSCYRLDAGSCIPRTPEYKVDCLSCFKNSEWEQLKQFWDFEPSWQNSIDSIRASEESFVYLAVYVEGAVAGYGIVEKETGDVPQIAVRRELRRRGIATDIAAALLEYTQAGGLRMINIDSTCEETKQFFRKIGCKPLVCQYEMMKKSPLRPDFSDSSYNSNSS